MMTSDPHPVDPRRRDALRGLLADPRQGGLAEESFADGRLTLFLPFNVAYVGNTWTGHIHGGVLTTLLDTVSRGVTVLHIPSHETVIPLDLRVDHLRPGSGLQGLRARAICRRVTETVVFVEADVLDIATHAVIVYGTTSLLRTPIGDVGDE